MKMQPDRPPSGIPDSHSQAGWATTATVLTAPNCISCNQGSQLGQLYFSPNISLYLYSSCCSICLPFPSELGATVIVSHFLSSISSIYSTSSISSICHNPNLTQSTKKIKKSILNLVRSAFPQVSFCNQFIVDPLHLEKSQPSRSSDASLGLSANANHHHHQG